MRHPLCVVTLIATTLSVVGCGFTAEKPVSIAPAGTGMHGRIKGGQAPVVGAVVSVYALGIDATGPKLLASTTSDDGGNFAFNTTPGNSYSCDTALPSLAPVKSLETTSPQAVSAKAPPSQKSSSGKPGGRLRPRPAVLPTQTDAYLYILAAGGNPGGGDNSSISLAAGLGNCTDAQNETVEINEVTTVVFATLMRNFGDGTPFLGVLSGDPKQINAMEIADTNAFQTLIDLPTASVNPNTTSTPGGTSITIEAAKIYSFANTIASCVNSSDDTSTLPASPSAACQTLFADSAVDGTTPVDTFQAATLMTFAPGNNVTALYQLAGATPPFTGLSNPPNDWTIGASYSTTAAGLGLFPTAGGQPTSSNIDIDSLGRVWFPSNKSGDQGIGYFDPTEAELHTVSFLNFQVNPEYIALDDPNQRMWVNDSASVNWIAVDTSVGNEGNDIETISNVVANELNKGPLFVNSDQSVVSSAETTAGVYQAYRYDPVADDTSLMATLPLNPTGISIDSFYNDPTSPGSFNATSDGANACVLSFASLDFGGHPLVEETGGPCTSGGIATAAYLINPGRADAIATLPTMNAYCSVILGTCTDPSGLLNAPQGVAVDGQNNVWIANSGDGSLYVLSGSFGSGGIPTYTGPTVAYRHDAANGATMTTPVGIAIDRAGNVWTSNANCTSPTDATCVYTLSEVFGAAAPTYTPLSLQADRLQGTEPGTDLPAVEGTGSPRSSKKQRPAPASH